MEQLGLVIAFLLMLMVIVRTLYYSRHLSHAGHEVNTQKIPEGVKILSQQAESYDVVLSIHAFKSASLLDGNYSLVNITTAKFAGGETQTKKKLTIILSEEL